MSRKEKVYRGSGNVFADIGLRNPERVMARSRIMSRITDLIRQRGLTQQQAAKLLGIPQSKVSCLMNGKLSMFSLDHLFELLNALDSNVEIIIKPITRSEKVATTQVFETLELLAIPDMRKSIREARADIRAGRTKLLKEILKAERQIKRGQTVPWTEVKRRHKL